jgi:branched-chain amino acid transport system ATP-binding protein
MNAVLTLRDVAAGYGETVVLDHIDLSIAPGESLAIVGRNGVGKTTLLATIMGHTALRRGRIFLHGKDIGALKPYRRARAGVAFVPQEREIFPSLTLRENLEIAARPGPWDIAAIYRLFPRLHAREHHYGNQLSGGEQQMLAIARALIGNPSLLLMDEPSEGLAPVVIEELVGILRRLTRTDGPSLILVEQNSALALEIAPRIAVMDRGRIVHDGASADLRRDPERLNRLIGVAERL